MTRNLLLVAARSLAAAQHSDDPEVATFYCAHARLTLAKAKAELKEIAMMLQAREKELVRHGNPKSQLGIGEGKP
jgi:hypothetical protein